MAIVLKVIIVDKLWTLSRNISLLERTAERNDSLAICVLRALFKRQNRTDSGNCLRDVKFLEAVIGMDVIDRSWDSCIKMIWEREALLCLASWNKYSKTETIGASLLRGIAWCGWKEWEKILEIETRSREALLGHNHNMGIITIVQYALVRGLRYKVRALSRLSAHLRYYLASADLHSHVPPSSHRKNHIS